MINTSFTELTLQGIEEVGFTQTHIKEALKDASLCDEIELMLQLQLNWIPKQKEWYTVSRLLGFDHEDGKLFAEAELEWDVSRETLWPIDEFFLKMAYSGKSSYRFKPLNTHGVEAFYPVVDSYEWVKRLIGVGVKTLQLRIKKGSMSEEALDNEIQNAIVYAKQSGVQLFINDHWELAIRHGALGVHLGQEDLFEANIDEIHDAGLLLGISTHSYHEILRACEFKPSYVALGHIFPTTTKTMPSQPQGLTKLRLYQAALKHIPGNFKSVAIGGIDMSNAQQVWDCGVDSLAVVRAVTESRDLIETYKFFKHLVSTR